ncbi:BPSL0761 family protein [Salinisphaera sp. SWV1]|uniref:BPSL0761 family protein n=1 Tax=Salinisphaera sp. SWV1 TaxID=3454139 RepID=UPI003F858272
MTLPYERTRAVIETEKFLRNVEVDKTLPEYVRKSASALLRHYPSEYEVCLAGKALEQEVPWLQVFSSQPYFAYEQHSNQKFDG